MPTRVTTPTKDRDGDTGTSVRHSTRKGSGGGEEGEVGEGSLNLYTERGGRLTSGLA